MIFILADNSTIHTGCGLPSSPVPQGILSCYIPVCAKDIWSEEGSC